jgi:ribosome maturation factor RimP
MVSIRVGPFAHFFILCAAQGVQTGSLKMATYREEIIGLIEPVIESEGLELVELECLRMKTRWLVRIFIDREGGATLDDCASISHQAGDLLNVHDLPPGPYTLEVSTPGF